MCLGDAPQKCVRWFLKHRTCTEHGKVEQKLLYDVKKYEEF